MMKKPVTIMRMLIVAFAAMMFAVGISPVSAQQAEAPSWMPKPPKATGGDKCDNDPQWMRRWHMKILSHKRDETMRQGIRTDKYSLKRCITCHAVKNDAGKYITVKDKRHFCRSCHDYAAVRMDCFSCHASRPGDKMSSASKGARNPHKSAAANSDTGIHKGTTFAEFRNFAMGEGQ